MKLKLKLYLLILGVLGSFFTFLWFRTINISTIKPLIFSWESFGYIALCCCFTFANLVLRWLRWYFLIRRNTHEIATRTGLLLYFATLPMILTPFCIGELIRVPLVRRGHHVAVGNLFSAWLIERANDVFILSTFWIFAKYGFNAGVSSFCAGFIITFLLLFFSSKKTPGFVFSLYSTLIVAVISLVSWILPVFALQFVVSGVSESLGFIEALDSFSHSTLLGGMSGVPVGISVTGSSLIELMQLFGIDDTYSILSVVIFRTGTAWFSVLLGILVLFVKRDSLADYLRRSDTSNHFDDIANEYEGQIPEHIRQRLLSKKVNVTEKCIAENAIRSGALGLDLGCGQGWYLLELAKKGYSMWGVDRSIEQLKNAVGNASLIGQKINTAQSDASELPFQSNTFDFVYSINVLHHITDPVVRAKVLTEIVRILKPGGIFMLHEINTLNPVFRFYMGYLFPILNKIDEGTEEWISPVNLPQVSGSVWSKHNAYFTFLPDFIPMRIMRILQGLEHRLEKSKFARFSAHYLACLKKDISSIEQSKKVC